MRRSKRFVPVAVGVLSAGVSAWGGAVLGQERTIVSSRVEIYDRAASLNLDFDYGEPFSAALATPGSEASPDDDRRSRGVVLINGATSGTYEPGGALDRAWRGLLTDAQSLSGRRLADALRDWAPDGDDEAAEALEGALEDALAGSPRSLGRNEGSRLRALLRAVTLSSDAGSLAEAMAAVDLESVEIHVEDDVTVEAGESTSSGLLVVRGRLDLQGRVAGDVVVWDGSAALGAEGVVEGDLHLHRASLDRRGGRVEGRVIDHSEAASENDRIQDRIREEVRRELARDRSAASREGSVPSRVGQVVHDLSKVLFALAAMVLTTVLALRVAGDRVRVVTWEAARNPARCALIGFAGAFLALPLYVVGIVGLAITVVGIVGLVVWIPLYPVAVVAAALLGLVGVSYSVGRWVLDRDLSWPDWIDSENPVHLRLAGVGTFFLPCVAGTLLGALPIIGWLGGIAAALGTVAVALAMTIGLGAVISTRAGNRPATWAYGNDDEEIDADVDDAWSDDAGDPPVSSAEDEEVGAGPAEGGGVDDDGAGAGSDRPEGAP